MKTPPAFRPTQRTVQRRVQQR